MAKLKPNIVVLELTRKCNLACKHCSSPPASTESVELSTTDWLKVLDRLRSAGSRQVVMSGGEPFLHAGFFDILAAACARFERVGITSNGLCLTDDTADKLVRCGAEEIQISIDGNEQEHDTLRGKGNYGRGLKAIDLAKRRGLRVYAMTVLSILNYRSIPELIVELSRHQVDHICFERLTPVGRGSALAKWCLTKEVLREALEIIRKMSTSYPLSVNDPLQELLNETQVPNACDTICGGCLAGFLNFAITPDGTIIPCTRLPIAMGSALSDSWETVLETDLSKGLLMRTFTGKCKKCDLVLSCGGCRAEAYAHSGDPFGEDPCCWKEAR